MLVLMLAPLSAAFARSCDCVSDETNTAALAPIQCCGDLPQSCCYKSYDGNVSVADWFTQSSSVLRLAQPALLLQFSVMRPMDAHVTTKLVCAPRAERPPGAMRRELSLQQSWLI